MDCGFVEFVIPEAELPHRAKKDSTTVKVGMELGIIFDPKVASSVFGTVVPFDSTA